MVCVTTSTKMSPINTIVDFFHDELSAGEFVNEIKSQEGVQFATFW